MCSCGIGGALPVSTAAAAAVNSSLAASLGGAYGVTNPFAFNSLALSSPVLASPALATSAALAAGNPFLTSAALGSPFGFGALASPALATSAALAATNPYLTGAALASPLGLGFGALGNPALAAAAYNPFATAALASPYSLASPFGVGPVAPLAGAGLYSAAFGGCNC